MLNVLAGALVGGLFNVACYIIVQKIRGQPISWKEAVGSFVGGAAAGAVAGASFGASLMAGGFFKATGFLAADGALGSVVETGTNNALEGNPLMQGVAHDAVIGAVEAPIFFGATKGIAKAIPELGPVLEGDDGGGAGAKPKPKTVREHAKVAVKRVKTTAARAGRAALHYMKHAPAHHHSALAVALANQFQGWGGQLLQGIWGYLIQVPDFWGSGGSGSSDSSGSSGSSGSGSSSDAGVPAPPPTTHGLTGALGHAGAR